MADVIVPVGTVGAYLDANHYLGAARRGWAWSDADGVAVLASPTARHLPTGWLELTRWCLEGGPNAGSRQWAVIRAAILTEFGDVTTVVSYSDPSVGHDGALYRACGWAWAPTWHRLREPPTGQGAWTDGRRQAAKDRWIDPLRPDPLRCGVLSLKDPAVERRFPSAEYVEAQVRRGRVVRGTAGGDYAAWRAAVT